MVGKSGVKKREKKYFYLSSWGKFWQEKGNMHMGGVKYHTTEVGNI